MALRLHATTLDLDNLIPLNETAGDERCASSRARVRSTTAAPGDRFDSDEREDYQGLRGFTADILP